jgi:hypothetical protein
MEDGRLDSPNYSQARKGLPWLVSTPPLSFSRLSNGVSLRVLAGPIVEYSIYCNVPRESALAAEVENGPTEQRPDSEVLVQWKSLLDPA